MLLMAKPKPPGRRGPGRPQTDTPTVPVSTRIPQEIADILAALARRNRRSISAEVLIAVEERLQKLGLWSPPAE